jgi:hypothetical protein
MYSVVRRGVGSPDVARHPQTTGKDMEIHGLILPGRRVALENLATGLGAVAGGLPFSFRI